MISVGSRAMGAVVDANDGRRGRDHLAGLTAMGSWKKVDWLMLSSSSSSDTDVVDCDAEGLLYILLYSKSEYDDRDEDERRQGTVQ
jgi:hypothetical protein